jgi:ubiquinone biosynthesis protein UbiJ
MTDLLAITAVAQRLDDIALLAANVRRLRERLAKLDDITNGATND